jgi:5-methylcytosine-specific restriction enzyme A
MPWSAPKHCAHGHPPYHGARCQLCAAQSRARSEVKRPGSTAQGYGYKWQQARAEFLKSNPVCLTCGAPSNVVDHIKPHKGDQGLFWRRSNWQPLCTPCHNSKTARQDGGFGRPTTPGGLHNPESVAPRALGKEQTQYRQNWEF